MKFEKKYILLLSFSVFLILLNVIFRPYLLENQSFSRVIFDRNGKLLKITLNNQEKYKLFVQLKKIPKNFIKSVILYEDKYFYYHFGFNPFSLTRAFFSLFQNRKLGASTITMQVVRITNDLNTKNIIGKVRQIIKAVQLESFYNKNEILEAYLNLVPYGHNIEGVGAASLIYFNTKVENLSISEILALTVIPQNPTKRVPTNTNSFQTMIKAREKLSENWFKENKLEPLLPINVKINLPNESMHIVQEMLELSNNNEINTTIDLNIQKQVEKIVNSYILQKTRYGVHNAAVLLIDSENMNVIVNIGSKDFFNNEIYGQVNGIKALRSPGSALKPFIYALALDQGLIHSKTILKDIPKSFGVYNPENSDRQFMGTVSADLALVYSRNVPAVDLLKKLKPSSFYNLLIKSGVNLKSEDFYGLALALGGYEISMEQVGKLYAALLNRGIIKELKKEINDNKNSETKILSPEASYITIKMLEQNPAINDYSKYITIKNKTKPIAWKTGTSFGFKDAWAVGNIGSYVLVVWIGNFDGRGNNSFKGREMAGPLFFNIANFLERTNSKIKKYKYNTINLNIKEVEVCNTTGDLKTNLCPTSIQALFIPMVSPIKSSNIYRKVPINIKTGKRACYSNSPYTKDEIFEFWPSDLENAKHMVGIYLKKPPEFEENCDLNIKHIYGKEPEIISPSNNLIYYKENDKKLPLKVITDTNVKKVFWFINQNFIGEIQSNKTLFIYPEKGKQTVSVIDDNGNSTFVNITVK